MNRIKILFFLLLTIAFSCSKDFYGQCRTERPIEEIEWLNALANDCQSDLSCNTIIFQGRFEKSTVYFTTMSGPLCCGVFHLTLRDCDGEIIKEYGIDNSSQLFYDEVDDIRQLFVCSM